MNGSRQAKGGWTTYTLGGLALLGLGMAAIAAVVSARDNLALTVLWLTAASGLGLVTGFVTGASKGDSPMGNYLKFVSGGILVPLLGGIAGLAQATEVVEIQNRYMGGDLVHQVTETSFVPAAPILHPLALSGAFIVFFSLLAVMGVLIGQHHRKDFGGEILLG